MTRNLNQPMNDLSNIQLLLILIGLLLFIVLFVFIYYKFKILNKRKKDLKTVNAHYVSEDLIKFMNILEKDSENIVLRNIMLENKYAKNNLTFLPLLLIRKNTVFMISNVVKTESKEMEMINNLLRVSNSEILDMDACDQIEKLVKKSITVPQMQKIVLTQTRAEINRVDDFDIVAQIDFYDFIQNQTFTHWSDQEIKTLQEFLERENIYSKTQ
ncbi:hypothetical protein [Mycoplasma sp. Ms02]|uniref:hypothetical protein n=1 Tax=Mycoplasma sp. Ms02 TaxID=353851 RepID=UPI001C8AEC82|nr:hypothetical protein [Mycoplasma sp. Ms02]QZE12348.1 hypothetical protein K4L35_03380 [Mycoplasma sp. Ms02]